MSPQPLDRFSSNWHKLEEICLIFEDYLIDHWKSLVMDHYHPDFHQTPESFLSVTLDHYRESDLQVRSAEDDDDDGGGENISDVSLDRTARENIHPSDYSLSWSSHPSLIVLEQDVFVYSDSVFVILLVDMYLCKKACGKYWRNMR